MLFNSIIFIFGFLPVTLIGYWLLAATPWHRPRLWWLILASLFFYAYWAPRYALLLIAAMIVNYAIGQVLQRTPPAAKRRRGWILAAGVGFNLALLFYFKYFNFFIDNVNALLGTDFAVGRIVLPLAISFFTFQKIALLFDLDRGKVRLGGVSEFSTFVLFFPQLIAGPIVHYSELEPQLAAPPSRATAGRDIVIGLTIFAIGLFKKTVLADSAALYASPIFDAARDGAAPGFAGAWLAAGAYTLQIYFDFSGYSDMAIGLARMFGVVMPLNFHSPLRARNMAELWRRWHTTLSRFVQSYIFQPLSIPLARWAAGHTRGAFAFLALSTLLPTFLAMVIIGAWHGAGWNFFIFGAMHGVFVASYEAWAFATKKRRKGRVEPWWERAFAHVLTVMCFVAAVVPFRAADVGVTGRFFAGMIGLHGLGGDWPARVPFGAGGMALILAAGAAIVALLPNTQHFMTRVTPALEWKKWRGVGLPPIALQWAPTLGWSLAIGVVLMLGIAFISRGTTEFIYFNF